MICNASSFTTKVAFFFANSIRKAFFKLIPLSFEVNTSSGGSKSSEAEEVSTILIPYLASSSSLTSVQGVSSQSNWAGNSKAFKIFSSTSLPDKRKSWNFFRRSCFSRHSSASGKITSVLPGNATPANETSNSEVMNASRFLRCNFNSLSKLRARRP